MIIIKPISPLIMKPIFQWNVTGGFRKSRCSLAKNYLDFRWHSVLTTSGCLESVRVGSGWFDVGVPDLCRENPLVGKFVGGDWFNNRYRYDFLMVMVLGVPDFYHGNLSFKSSGTSISLNSFISRPLERFGPRGLWRYALDFLHNYLGYRRLVWKFLPGKLGIGLSFGFDPVTAVKITSFGGVGIFTKVIAKMVVFGPVWMGAFPIRNIINPS